MNELFPLKSCLGIPHGHHPGAFGFRRKHDVHTGVDLYCAPGAPVRAMEDGQVLDTGLFTGPELGHPWWNTTWYLTVAGKSGLVVYGEIHRSLWRPGCFVRRGDTLAFVKPVLPPEKVRADIPGHSNAMLHMELFHGETLIKPFSISLLQTLPPLLGDPTELLRHSDEAPDFLPEWGGSLIPDIPAERPPTEQELQILENGTKMAFHEDHGHVVQGSDGCSFVPDKGGYLLFFPRGAKMSVRTQEPAYLRLVDHQGLWRKIRRLPIANQL